MMNRLSIYNIVINGIPEGILGMYAIYVFTNKKPYYQKILISGFVMGAFVYAARLLPIQFGAHTIIGLFCQMVLAVTIHKTGLLAAMKACVLYMILMVSSEILTLFLMSRSLGMSMRSLVSHASLMPWVGIPSTILIFTLLVFIDLIHRRKFI